MKILVKTCILLYKYKINSRQILRLLLEKYTKEVIEYFNNDCTVDETKILTEMIKKLFILSIKHRKEFPVHLLSHCKKGRNRPWWFWIRTPDYPPMASRRRQGFLDWNFAFRANISWFGNLAWKMFVNRAKRTKYFGNIIGWNLGK